MNYTDYADYYKAEVAYRREQMPSEREPIRIWRRVSKAAAGSAAKNHTR